MGSPDTATYDALPTEPKVILSSASRWCQAPMTGAAVRIRGAVPTIDLDGGPERSESYIVTEPGR